MRPHRGEVPLTASIRQGMRIVATIKIDFSQITVRGCQTGVSRFQLLEQREGFGLSINMEENPGLITLYRCGRWRRLAAAISAEVVWLRAMGDAKRSEILQVAPTTGISK
jgi:hypothetical protein